MSLPHRTDRTAIATERPAIILGLVSTIIPVFNRAAMLREAVASVLAQDYRPIEIILVDDGSTDDTGAVADALAREHADLVQALHVANGGPGAAREAGREVARGEFIQYLDSDDLLLPVKFAAQVEGLRARPACGVAYGKTRFYRLGDEPKNRPWKRTDETIARMFPSLLQSRWWGTSTPLYRRSITDAAGPWTNLRNEEDWEYDCRIAAQGVALWQCDAFVSDQRDHPNSRLSHRGSTDPAKLADRAEAHALIYAHARTAGLGPGVPEMAHFARELFLLARQCGAAGRSAEARDLFALAREASGPGRGRGLDFRLYRLAASAIGWSNAGRVACQLDRLRP